MERLTDGIKDLISYDGMLQHAWMLVISIVAGIVRHFERMENEDKFKLNVLMFIYDLFASSFMGLMAMYACISACSDIYITAVIVGVSAHSGTKSLNSILKLIAGKFKVSVVIDSKDKKSG